MSARADAILCISTYLKGQAFLREAARLGCRVSLLTVERLADADWPRDILADFFTMPGVMTTDQVIRTVAWLARDHHFDRIIALDEFDMELVATLREHMRIPGMGASTTNLFRDKLAMRVRARDAGIPVPHFTAVFNYDDLRDWMSRIPAPWVLKPRSQASSLGIRKLHNDEDLWRALDVLGDDQSNFVLEQFIPGKVFHVDGIISNREVLLAAAHEYGQPPMQLTHEGGVFTTRLLERGSTLSQSLAAMHDMVAQAFRMVYGVTHTEYIQASADGQIYFLEAAARVGGAFIADVIEASYGIDPWIEWARIEVAALRNQRYQLPPLRSDYAGSVLCLAQQEAPDTSAYDAPEIVLRVSKHHHAGLIIRSPQAARVQTLLADYGRRFLTDFCAVLPAPEKPTA